jgi:hypothetical protein
MTRDQAQQLLAHATRMVDEITERIADGFHDTLVRKGLSGDEVDAHMQALYKKCDAIRTEALIDLTEIAHRFVADENKVIH